MFSRINITFFFSLSTDIFFSPVNVVIKIMFPQGILGYVFDDRYTNVIKLKIYSKYDESYLSITLKL